MRLSNRCYAVTGLGYSPPWCVNAGFVTGDHTTLVIDTGGNTLAAQSIFGYASAARPGNRLLVVNTEQHFDHIGGNGFFRDRGVDVWGHIGIARTEAEFQAEIAEFNASIPNPVRRAAGEARVFFHATHVTNPNCGIIDQDTRFDLGGCSAEILLTPGHTPTNVSVWVRQDRVLFTGDCLICEYLPNLDSGGPVEWSSWLESLDRLEQLSPACVLAGHGPIAQGEEIRAAVDSLRTLLANAIALGRSPTSNSSG